MSPSDALMLVLFVIRCVRQTVSTGTTRGVESHSGPNWNRWSWTQPNWNTCLRQSQRKYQLQRYVTVRYWLQKLLLAASKCREIIHLITINRTSSKFAFYINYQIFVKQLKVFVHYFFTLKADFSQVKQGHVCLDPDQTVQSVVILTKPQNKKNMICKEGKIKPGLSHFDPLLPPPPPPLPPNIFLSWMS